MIKKMKNKNFRSYAKIWWDKKNKLKILHSINPLRLNYILQYSNGIFGKTILDVGCGGGILAESMTKEGALVTGIDIEKKLLETAKKHSLKKKLKINYIEEKVEKHAKKYSKKYDIITCMEVLEHVKNPQSIVQACAKLLKPNGNIFFSTINRNIKSWLFIIFFSEYILHILPRGIHKFKKFIKPSELLSWTDKTSLQAQNIAGLHYNPINNKFWLDSNIKVNYILHLSNINY